MCGIAGFVVAETNTIAADKIIRGMAATLYHRGPDQTGVWLDRHCALGHTRLSIIDIQSGAQPMTARNGNVLVFNGEIYNFREIRAHLEAKGITFKTQSDTEVLLESYNFWGQACLQEFNGMFAFAIWNPADRTLFLARDRLGKKPLFIYRSKNLFAFASEIKSLLQLQEIGGGFDMDPRAISDFMSLGYILTPKTIFRQISKLPAATSALYSLESDGVRETEYWRLSDFYTAGKLDYGQRERDHFVELLDDAVSIRLRSDVPLGGFLSGGLDSSSIVTAVKRKAQAETKAYAVVFEDQSFDESMYAELAAKHVEIPLEMIRHETFDPSRFADLVWHTDEPFADTSIVPTYSLCQAARKQLTVALSGDGADELFAGYATYTADRLFPYYERLPGFLQNILIQVAATVLKPSYRKVSFDYKVRNFLESAGMDRRQAHYWWRNIFTENEKKSLMSPELRDACGDYNPFDTFSAYFDQVQSADFLDQCLYVDIKTWLQDDILVKLDRMSMANSLEVRSPFLDYRIVEFAARLPMHAKKTWRNDKVIVRQSMSSVLPASILNRSKRGFNSPRPENGSLSVTADRWDTFFNPDFTLDPKIEDITFKSFSLDVLNSWLAMYAAFKDTGKWKAQTHG
jgi:asparagine synthase (glutamine-hydrolysing)